MLERKKEILDDLVDVKKKIAYYHKEPYSKAIEWAIEKVKDAIAILKTVEG